ncbi:MAG: type II toxin-antitoxin system VapC family toxin [Chloroflexota bacterium]
MPYLIDTDWLIDYLAGEADAQVLIDPLVPAGIAISIIFYMEAYQGVLRSPDPRQAEARLNAFLQTVPVLPFSVQVAQRCATLREDLRKQGKRVRSRALDLLTAAIALEYDLTLVTRNKDDFKDIPGLTLL